MENKAALIAKIKERVDFILGEIGKVPISQKTKSEIQSICTEITNVLSNAEEKDDGELLAQLRRQLARFDALIGEIVGDKKEMAAYALLNVQQAELIQLVSGAEEL